MMRGSRAWRLHAAAILTCSAAASVFAEPMAKEACDAAEAERATLLAGGIQETVKKGPAWAKANLPPQKLKDVERYIALQEQLLFKCGQAKLRTLPLNDGEDGAEGPATAKDAAAAPGEAKKPSAAKPKPAPRKAAPKVEASTPAEPTTAGDAVATPKAAPKPRPKPKPKVDDAYRPPKPIPQPATE